MTMSMVQGTVPSAEVIEVRSKPDQGFPKALHNASDRRAEGSALGHEAEDTDSSTAVDHKGNRSERAQSRSDARGPDHATGLERAAEMSSKPHPSVSKLGEEVIEPPPDISEAVNVVPVVVEDVLPENQIVDNQTVNGDMSIDLAEILGHEAVAKEQSVVLPETNDDFPASEEVVAPEAVEAAPLVEVAIDPQALTGAEPEMATILIASEAANPLLKTDEENTSSRGISEAVELDLEALSQFLVTVPQSHDSVAVPLEVLVSESTQVVSEVTPQETVPSNNGQGKVSDPQVITSGNQQAPLAHNEQSSSGGGTASSASTSNQGPPEVALSGGIANAITRFESSGAEVSSQALVSNSPVVAQQPGVSVDETSAVPEGQLLDGTAASQNSDTGSMQNPSQHPPSQQPQIADSQREVTPGHSASAVDTSGVVGEVARDLTRNEIGEPMGRAMVRLVERIEALRNAPPPRTMVLELRELDGVRVRVSLEGNSVRMNVMGGSLDSGAREQLDQELSQALSQRGFDLTGQNEEEQAQWEEVQEQGVSETTPRPQTPTQTASGLRI